MPNIPSPFKMRDWKKVALNYDAFVFDFNNTGKYLPLIWWDKTHHNFDRDGFGLYTYVGPRSAQEGNRHEALNCMAAVVGATLVGIDKSNQRGHNWVLMCENYFAKDNGENVYLNTTRIASGRSFWYEVMPNLLFYELLYYYPGTGNMDSEMFTVADRWYEACVAMGGSVQPERLPNFNHTAFALKTMKPFDNGKRVEPEGAAGVAWLQYIAYVKSHKEKYLTAADWCLRFLQNEKENPFYEVILPYGAYVAARMNAELGKNYDVDKIINWCFGPSDARPGWGIITDKWSDYDCHGLTGSLTDGGGYAFAMNTFQMAGELVPLVRYDQRYARAIGKLMLNMANNARFFYANALPAEHQSGKQWADMYDRNYCMGYEGFRKHGRLITKVTGEQTVNGTVLSGSYTDTVLRDKEIEVFKEKDASLKHLWTVSIPPGVTNVIADAYAEGAIFKFSYSTNKDGPYTDMFTVTSPRLKRHSTGMDGMINFSGTVYIKAESAYPPSAENRQGTLYVDFIATSTESNIIPYAMGDSFSSYYGSGETDFGLYGSSHVGVLGGIVSTTNDEKILQLDLLKTDYYHADAYPSYLYYNPYMETKEVKINVGLEQKNLYDAVTGRFLKTAVKGQTSFTIGPDSAVVLVLTPAGGKVAYSKDGKKMLIDAVVVNYLLH
jgi:hypothetical protein